MVLTEHPQSCIAKFPVLGHFRMVQRPFLDADDLRAFSFVVLSRRKSFSAVTGLSVLPDGIIARRGPLRQVLFWGGFHWD